LVAWGIMVVRSTSADGRIRRASRAAAAVLAAGLSVGACAAGEGAETAAPAEAAIAGNGEAGGADGAQDPAVAAPAAPATDDPAATSATTTPTTAAPTTEAPTTTAAPVTFTTPPAGPPANRVAVAALATPLFPVGDSNNDETARVQQRLLELGFWLDGATGRYDITTYQAVMAFQKYVGLETSGEVDADTATSLSAMTLRAYGHADAGTLIEIDKTRQLIFFYVDGKVEWVFNTSTGNGESYIEEDQNSPGTLVEGVSLTPDGLHKVNRERPVGWWDGDLGQIYRPKYFVGGIAIHGSNSVPNYPASHGCVRVTVQAMDFIWEAGLMPLTLPVWVHQQARPA